jgi:ribose transport system substrate-binding protein
MNIMDDFIVKYGDQIQGVFCHWDNGATGVIGALKNANMTGVFVVGVDGCRAGFDQVKDGSQAVCIGQSFTNMAIQSLKNAKAALTGGTYEAINFIPLDVVTADNIDTFPYPEW